MKRLCRVMQKKGRVEYWAVEIGWRCRLAFDREPMAAVFPKTHCDAGDVLSA